MNFIQTGNVGLNLELVAGWEWLPPSETLIVHMVGNREYFTGEQGKALWLLLDTLAVLRMGQRSPADDRDEPE